MTYGPGQPPNGWPPPSEPGPTVYGRRRVPDDDEPEPSPDYDHRAFEAPPVPPVGEAPYRPRRGADRESGPYGPRPEAPGAWPPAGPAGEGRPAGEDTGSARVPSPEPRRPDRTGNGYPPDAGPRPERTGGLYPMAPPSDTGGWNPPRPHPTGGFPSAPSHLTGGFASPHSFNPGGGLAPVEPMERTAWPERGTGSVPTQWGNAPGDPDLDLPDRRRRPGAFDRSARHGEPEPVARPKTTPWHTALGAAAVALLVAVCAAGSYFMFTDRGPGSGAVPAGPTVHDISNRTADPAPLTEAEVFPATTVGAGYQVLKTQPLTDCKAAAVGEPVKMLAVQDCTQVVRAVLLSADQAYVITAGLFNFGTQVNAQQASDSIRDSVGAQKGRFTGFNLGSPPSDVYARAATQLGWDVRGHFLAYCVIARADAKPIDANDQSAHQITDQLVEKYLIGAVLQARVSPPSSGPAPSAK